MCSCSYYLPNNYLKAADFFKEFSGFVDSLATNSGHMLILDDFNIHWDCQRNGDTKQLADLLRSANLRQHVQERTHWRGHILDLVISVMMTIWLKVCLCLPYCLIIFLLTLMYLYRNNLFQPRLFHIEDISLLVRRLLLLICKSLIWYWIYRMMWIIRWIYMIVHWETL